MDLSVGVKMALKDMLPAPANVRFRRVKRTCRLQRKMSAYDPKRTFVSRCSRLLHHGPTQPELGPLLLLMVQSVRTLEENYGHEKRPRRQN